MKICINCKIEKELYEFHKNGKWLRNTCRKCHNAKYQPPTGEPNSGQFQKGNIPKSPFKKGQAPWNKGKKHPEEIRKKMGRPGRKHSAEEIERRRQSLVKKWDAYIGYQRSSAASRRWSNEVRRRDDFTCQHCFSKPSKLHAHHIISWKDNEMLRHEISNGITLCVPCHKNLHKDNPQGGRPKGTKFTLEHRKKLSDARKGKAPWNKKSNGIGEFNGNK